MVMPHNIMQKAGELMKVYEEIQKGLTQHSPATVVHDLNVLHEFVVEIEREYGGMEQFLYEFATLKTSVDSIKEDLTKIQEQLAGE